MFNKHGDRETSVCTGKESALKKIYIGPALAPVLIFKWIMDKKYTRVFK